MSMGTSAAFDYVMNAKVVETVVGAELYATYVKQLADAEKNENFCYTEGEFDVDACDLDPDDPTVASFLDTLDKVTTTFKEKTGIGISLYYHGYDCGDRYDDVMGWFWSANESDLYTIVPSKAYADLNDKYKEMCEEDNNVCPRKFYTIFG